MKEENILTMADFSNWESRSGMRATPSTLKKEGKSTIVEAVLTTEKEAEVIDWERWEIVKEVLLMSGAQIPENKQVPFLDSHSRFSTSSIKGSIRNLRIEENKLVGDVHIWSEAKEISSLIEEGHLTDLSVGYKVSESETVEIKPGAEAVIDGKTYKNTDPKMRMLIRTKFWVKEGSAVAIGADDTSKFRNLLQQVIKPEDPEIIKLKNELIALNQKFDSIKIGEKKPMKEQEELTVEQRAEKEVERRIQLKEIAEKFGKNYKPGETKLRDALEAAIKNNSSVEYFKAHIFDNFDSSKSVDQPVTQIDLSKKDMKDYSLLEGINAMFSGTFGSGKSGIVKEVSDEIAKRISKLGVNPHENSFYVPNEYWGKHLDNAQFNLKAMDATTVGGGTGGSNLVGTQFRGDLFIELLRSKLALGQAGVSMLTGLKENIKIPKQLTDGTFEIVGEGLAASESALTFDQLDGSPKIGSGWQEFTKLLLLQGDPSIEALVRDSLLAVASRGIDRYGLVGGTGITGLLNETGPAPVVIGGDPDWSEIVSFETKIETANANIGEIKWLMPPYIKGRCKTIPKLSGSQFSGWLMETGGKMNEYDSVISTLVPDYYLILGVFKQMWLCTWGATEIQVNPFIKMKEGIVQIIIFAYFDWLVRQPTAFAISDDVTES